MSKLDCSLPKLVNMLVTAEGILKSLWGSILAVEQASSFRRKFSWKKKNNPVKKEKKEKRSKKDAPKKAADKEKYFHYNTDSHWKRNYLLYLKSLKIKKDDTPSEGMSRMLVIESNLMIFSTFDWVLYSDSHAHIYI